MTAPQPLMPGCSSHVSLDAAELVLGSNGVAVYQLTIPNSIGFVGLRLYHQALVLDPQVGNPLGAVLSTAMEAFIGY